jgi:tetratricopeptide (TPR) repeat protein
VKKLFDHREVSRLTGISEGRIRAWSKQGLTPHQEKIKGTLLFDFRGLVALRTIRDLRQQGVPLRKIKKCLARLKHLLPDLSQPLAEVRINLVKGRLICGRHRKRFTPEGQLLLDFSGKEPRPGTRQALEAVEALFFQALEDEQAEKWDEAKRKYETLLGLLPRHVDALVNLGNILYLTGKETEAAAHYFQALRLDPGHAEGNYNFANLLADRGDLDKAMLFYQRALETDPDFVEAHFNLAVTLEDKGDLAGARRHWERYLELDPEGEWAEYIKKRLD